MSEFVQMSKTHEEGDNSWVIDVADINKDTYDLTVTIPIQLKRLITELHKKSLQR